MTKRSPAVDRAVRIELLRARAAIERESLAQGIVSAGRKLEPAALLKSFLPGLASGGASRWAMQAIGLARRYPLISSSLSAMFMRGGGKSTRADAIAPSGRAHDPARPAGFLFAAPLLSVP